MSKWKKPVDVLRNSLTIEWDDRSAQCIGSDTVHFLTGNMRVTMDADVGFACVSMGNVRLLSSTGSADGMVKYARERYSRLVGLEIELFGDVDEFIEGASDWVMIQFAA